MDVRASADVAVLGGGVAGLACALRLRSLLPAAVVTVIEAERIPGGKVRGDEVGDCIVDGGPDLCVESKLARTHSYGSLGLSKDLIPVNPDRYPTFLRRGESLSAMSRLIGEGLVTMSAGMHDIVRRMTAAIPDGTLQLGNQVRAIDRSDGAWHISLESGRVVTASAIVCAVPGRAAKRLLQGVAPALSAVAGRLRYSPMTTVTAAWAASAVAHDLRGTGYIDAVADDRMMSACTWTSSKIPTRSRRGIVLLRGYVRFADAETATRVAVADMKATLAISADPLWTRAFVWSDAIPVYARGCSASIAALRNDGSLPEGLAVAGAAWDGIGVGDCIASGERAAEMAAAMSSAGVSP